MFSELSAFSNLSITQSDTALLGGAKKFQAAMDRGLISKIVIIRILIQWTNCVKYPAILVMS